MDQFPFVATFHVVLDRVVGHADPDTWVGHCLDLDVVAQGGPGRGATGAWLALREAIEVACQDDLSESLNLLDVRRRPPAEDWHELLLALRRGTRVATMDALEGQRKFTSLVTVAFVRVARGAREIAETTATATRIRRSSPCRPAR